MPNSTIVITGPRGTGKSILAATYLDPDQAGGVYVHDSENSMNKIVADLEEAKTPFGRYVDLKSRFAHLPSDEDLLDQISKGNLPWVDRKAKTGLMEYYQYIVRDLAKNLEPGKYKLYIMDTLEKFEAGMVAWADSHRKKAGATGGPSSSKFGQFWWGAYYPLYDQFFSAIFERGVETVIMCSHLKTPWQDKKRIPGKVQPSGKPILYKLSSLFLWLINERGNADGAPAGLVLKERMGKIKVVNGKWDITRMLPERIPHCTWETIREYLENGADLANPKPGEVMSDDEKDMISELLNNEQMRLMILEAEREEREAKEAEIPIQVPGSGAFIPPKNGGDAQRWAEMVKNGATVEEVAQEVGKPVPVVRMALQTVEEESESE